MKKKNCGIRALTVLGFLFACSMPLVAAEKFFELTSEPTGATVVVYDKGKNIVEETTTPAKISLKGKLPFTIEITNDNYGKQTLTVKKEGSKHIVLVKQLKKFEEISLEELKAKVAEMPWGTDKAVKEFADAEEYVVEGFCLFNLDSDTSFYISQNAYIPGTSRNSFSENAIHAFLMDYEYAETVKPLIEYEKKYKIHIYRIDHRDNFNGTFYDVTKIDGLQSAEEAAEKQKIAQKNKEIADEAEKKEKAEKLELAQNPNKLSRAAYKEITVEEFSFDMVAGKLPVGSKVAFFANFLTKPTGVTYSFENVNMLITVKSDHNFVKDIPNSYFTGMLYGNYVPSLTKVKVYMTVKKTGQTGECSVDIIEWR